MLLYVQTRRTIINKFRNFLSKISAKTCLKWIMLVVNPNRKAPGSTDPRLGSMTRECANLYFQWTCLVYADAWQFGGITILYIFCPNALFKKKKHFRATDCTNSRCSALLRICTSFYLCVWAQGIHATQLLVVPCIFVKVPRFRYSFICQGTSTRKQWRDLFGHWVKLPLVATSLTTQRYRQSR